MDTICEIASRHGIAVVEDAAHALGATYKGRTLGSIGQLATLSFHETKNLQCGEGGALLVNDPSMTLRAEILREKGTNRSQFFRGQVDKYTWVDVGSSYLPSDLLAAYLCAQLEAHDLIQARRQAIWRTYDTALAGWAARHGVRQPIVPAGCGHPAHIYYLLLPSLEARTRFLAHLRAHMILATFHYQPLHLSDMGRQFGGRAGQCPVTEDVADRLVRLPVFYQLTDDGLQRVVDAASSFAV
jgi:dTDP-4-amino-4,6-dideoxygalactose transaminase